MESIWNEESSNSIAIHMALLAKLKGETQESLSVKCGLSRITINRYFRRRNEIKARDFIRLLSCLEIDLYEIIQKKISEIHYGRIVEDNTVYDHTINLLKRLDHNVKRNFFEQIIWWTEANGIEHMKETSQKIKDYLIKRANT